MVVGMRFTSEDLCVPLRDGWTFAATEPGAIEDPDARKLDALAWQPASVPGTVAAALRDAGTWSVGDKNSFGSRDHWFRCRFSRPEAAGDISLLLGGLATVADVWFNGQHVLHSENMFRSYDLEITESVSDDNELLIRFDALETLLSKRRPRPHWHTALVKHQTLRWYRTTLLGHIKSWCPHVVAVGPWRGIELVVHPRVAIESSDLKVSVEDGVGRIDIDLGIASTGQVDKAVLWVGEHRGELDVTLSEGGRRARGRAQIADVSLWWPHTHGGQPLYAVRVELGIDGSTVGVDLGDVGFRTVAPVSVDEPGLVINGVDLYCRGACWTNLDVARLTGDTESYRIALETARDAGMNMLRVGGTMVYEHPDFYRLCDELGILVWQDFMFANMDYPVDDAQFMATAQAEAEQFLDRTQLRCSIAVLCGGSEVAQQAAMLGLSRELWSNTLFAELLPSVCTALRPDVPYWPSSPTGGPLPFHVRAGIAHYFGVGAYNREVDDARLRTPRFASECLAFSNVPEPRVLAELARGGFLAPHHPVYKERVSRDPTTGWDFADVTDHYVESLFGVDTRALRYADCERYFAHCRVGIGELLKTVTGFWRAAESANRGALIWFYRDLWSGAGWGLVDSEGLPKASYYYLRRSWAPRAIWLVDEGLEGLRAHIANDTAKPLRGAMRLCVLGAGDTVVAEYSEKVDVPPRSQVDFQVDRLLARFLDTTYAYRFGPRTQHVVIAHLQEEENGLILSDDYFFPGHLPNGSDPIIDLKAEVSGRDAGAFDVTFRSDRFCQAVAIDTPGFVPSDNYFHLTPGVAKSVTLQARDVTATLRGYAQAFNSTHSLRLAASEGS